MVTPINPIIQASLANAIPQALRQMLSADTPIFVACSGGRDSMALLYALSNMDLPIVAIHVNHRLQAPSDDWENLVKAFCQSHNITFLSKKLCFENPEAVSEQHARNARYEALITLIQEFYLQKLGSNEITLQEIDSQNNADGSTSPLPILALAHHANDQAETVLMNLCQGTGIQGLSGMREWTVQQEFTLPLGLWRPLLTVTREQISEYVAKHQLPYVDDPTNIGDGNQRAFLRQHIMPQLAERFGGLVQNIARTSHNLADASQSLDKQADTQLQQCQTPSWTTALHCLDIPKLHQLSQADRFYVLHFWLKQYRRFAPPQRLIENVNRLILSDNPDQQTILQWESQQIRRYRDTLYLLSEPYIGLLNWAKNQAKSELKILDNFVENSEINLIQIDDYYLSLVANVKQNFSPVFTFRQVKTGEKFQQVSHLHHQTFKNICQTLSVPSWERPLTLMVQSEESGEPVALVFPQLFTTQTIWLAGAEKSMREAATSAFTLIFEPVDSTQLLPSVDKKFSQ